MKLRKLEEESRLSIELHCPLVIEHAAEISKELLDCFSVEKNMELDLGHVSECDAAGIQLLFAAKKTAARLNVPLILKNTSPHVLETIRRIGLDTEKVIRSVEP